MNSSGTRNKQKGLALIVVLWVSIIITLLITSFTKIVRSSISKAETENSLSLHYSSLDSTFEFAMFRLIDQKQQKKWIHKQQIRKVQVHGKRFDIKIIDPKGLIDINYADKNILLSLIGRLIKNRNKAREITEQILSWRNKKNNGSSQKSDFSFRHYEELLRLPAMTGEYFDEIKRYITVYSGQKKINPATAPAEVLLSVPGLSKPLVENLLKQRSANPGDKKIYSDIITRSDGLLSLSRRNIHIIYISSPWGKTGKLVGRRYVAVTGLDAKRPYRLLSWSDYMSDERQGV